MKNVAKVIAQQASEIVLNRFSDMVVSYDLKCSLYDFFKDSWAVLEPGTELIDNWHLRTICAYLEAVHLGKIRRLIINVPPRSLKSTVVTICYPCWVWLHNPFLKSICVSYSLSLAYEHSMARRRLVTSDFYREFSENKIKLLDDKNQVSNFGNTFLGAMVAASMLGTVTGKGGYLIIDDPTSSTQAKSEKQRNAANLAYRLNLSTRLNDKKRDPIIVVQQRQDDMDLTGYLKTNDSGFVCLVLKGVAEKTEYYPLTHEVIMYGGEIDYSEKDDPHKFFKYEGGTLLNPLRENWEDINKLRIDLGEAGFSAQIQQEPSPDKGSILSYASFVGYAIQPKFDRVILSVDCTFKGNKTSDYVVILAIGEVINPVIINGVLFNNSHYYVISEWREQADFNTTEAQIINWIDAVKPHKVIIEDKANGPAIINRLSTNPYLTYLLEAYNVGSDSKEARARAITPIVSQNRVKVPLIPTATQFEGLTVEQILSLIGVEFKVIQEKDTPFHSFVPGFLTEINRFPVAQYDDRVDALTQAINWSEANPVSISSGIKPWLT